MSRLIRFRPTYLALCVAVFSGSCALFTQPSAVTQQLEDSGPSLEESWEAVSNEAEAATWFSAIERAQREREGGGGSESSDERAYRRAQAEVCAYNRIASLLGAEPLSAGWGPAAAEDGCTELSVSALLELGSLADLPDQLLAASRAAAIDFTDELWLAEMLVGAAAEADTLGPEERRDLAFKSWLARLDEAGGAGAFSNPTIAALLEATISSEFESLSAHCLTGVAPGPWVEDDVRLRLPWSVDPSPRETSPDQLASRASAAPMAWPELTLIVRSDALFVVPSPSLCWSQEHSAFVSSHAPLEEPVLRFSRPGALDSDDVAGGRVPSLAAKWGELAAELGANPQSVAVIADAETMVATYQALLLTLHDAGTLRALWWVDRRGSGGRFIGLPLLRDAGDAAVNISIRDDGYVITPRGDDAPDPVVVLRSSGSRLLEINRTLRSLELERGQKIVISFDEPSADIGLIAPLLDALLRPRLSDAESARDTDWLEQGVDPERAASIGLILRD